MYVPQNVLFGLIPAVKGQSIQEFVCCSKRAIWIYHSRKMSEEKFSIRKCSIHFGKGGPKICMLHKTCYLD